MESIQNTGSTTQSLQPASTNNQTVYYKHSGFAPRLLATVIDGIIILAVAFILNLLFQMVTGQPSDNKESSIFNLLATLITVAYEITFLTLYGATLGKMVLHLKVVNTNYQKLSFIQILKRETIGKILSGLAFNLGYLWVLVDEKKQAWHDKIAKTYVVHTEPISQEEHVKEQEVKHSKLPLVLLFAGALEAVFMLIMSLTVLPKLTSLYSELGSSYNVSLPYLLLGVGLLSSLAQAIYGFVLWSEQRSSGTIKKQHRTIGKTLLIVGAVLFTILTPLLIMSIILPIYNLTSQF